MKNRWLVVILFCSAVLSCSSRHAASASEQTGKTSPGLDKVISWLPADTETISVANGPFELKAVPSQSENRDRAISDMELAQIFEALPLELLQFRKNALARHFEGKRIALAVEGARHFHSPSGLGEGLFEGCAIAVFVDNIRDVVDSFAKENRKDALRVEQIEGREVLAFQEKLEEDLWTTYVAFPSEHVAVIATDRAYLTEVLARRNGHKGPTALPKDLPEWKYVNISSRFWGVRHYNKNQAGCDRYQPQCDPSSPFGGRKAANYPDEQAIGLTFEFDPSQGRTAKVTYLSGDPNILAKINTTTRGPLGMGDDPEAKDLAIRSREVVPGIVEGSYSLTQLRAVDLFVFVLMGRLGHPIYL